MFFKKKVYWFVDMIEEDEKVDILISISMYGMIL